MRLYPPVPHYFREISEDITIKGHLIPKGITIVFVLDNSFVTFTSSAGTMVTIGALELHRQPDIWENPEVNDRIGSLCMVVA